MTPHLQKISSEGSDRATGYNLSNKFIRKDGTLYAGWLDAPAEPGGLARVRLGVFDLPTGELRNVILLGHGKDNHCGPALALDHDGRMHAVIGGHHTPFQYLWSDNPSGAKSWSAPENMGPCDTYPALIADEKGTLHLLYRQGDYHDADPAAPPMPWRQWSLWYRRKPAGQPWERPVVIAVSPTPHYSHFMQSLSAGPDGALHLFFQFHYSEDGVEPHMRGHKGVYLRSEDGGDTWSNEEKPCRFPLTLETVIPFRDCPQRGLRINNHVIDSKGRPWIFTCVSTEREGVLHRRGENGWETVDIRSHFGDLDMSGGHGRDVSITRSRDGAIHLVIATNPGNQPGEWYDPRHELFHLVLDENGNSRSFKQLTQTDPNAAQWIPALENWDWVRKETVCADGPWLACTRGLNLGGIGGKNDNAMRTEVYLTHLDSPA